MKAEAFVLTPEFIRGRNGEYFVAHIYARIGKHVTWIGHDNPFAKGAPRTLTNISKSIILPDLLVSGSGATRAVEVKTKTSAWFQPGFATHGIDPRNWDAYNEWQNEHGIPLSLAIYEENKCNVYEAPIDAIRPHVWVGRMIKNNVDTGPIVNFPRDPIFKCVFNLLDLLQTSLDLAAAPGPIASALQAQRLPYDGGQRPKHDMFAEGEHEA